MSGLTFTVLDIFVYLERRSRFEYVVIIRFDHCNRAAYRRVYKVVLFESIDRRQLVR